MPSDVGNLMIDLGGVACDFNAQWRIDAFSRSCGKDPDAVRSAIYGSDLGVRADHGELDAGQLRAALLTRLDWSCDDDDFDRLWASAFRPSEPVLAILRSVRPDVSKSLFTNNDAILLDMFTSAFPQVAHVVGQLVFSCSLGAMKPSPVAFERALERVGAKPATTLFIDDSERNVTAAGALDIDAVQFVGPAGLAAELSRRGLITA